MFLCGFVHHACFSSVLFRGVSCSPAEVRFVPVGVGFLKVLLYSTVLRMSSARSLLCGVGGTKGRAFLRRCMHTGTRLGRPEWGACKGACILPPAFIAITSNADKLVYCCIGGDDLSAITLGSGQTWLPFLLIFVEKNCGSYCQYIFRCCMTSDVLYILHGVYFPPMCMCVCLGRHSTDSRRSCVPHPLFSSPRSGFRF